MAAELGEHQRKENAEAKHDKMRVCEGVTQCKARAQQKHKCVANQGIEDDDEDENDSPAWLKSVRKEECEREGMTSTASQGITPLLLSAVMTIWANKWITEWLEGLGRITLLAKDAICSLFTLKVAWNDLLYQIYFVGVRSQSVVLITGAFTGLVLGAQTYFQFHKVKMDTATLAVVGVSMCSELGPVLTGLMVAGRVGASIAAEIGSMKVTEQLDALRTLATHPVDYLVVPRLVAGHIALPLLTAEAIAIGIGSGYFVGVHLLGIDPTYLWWNMLQHTGTSDVAIGLFKS